MTSDEIAKVAIWAVDVADIYIIEVSKVMELFKGIHKACKDINNAKNMTEHMANKRVVIWVISTASKYNVKIATVVEVFREINKFHPNTETVKSMMVEGFEEAKRGQLANE